MVVFKSEITQGLGCAIAFECNFDGTWELQKLPFCLFCPNSWDTNMRILAS